VTGGNASARALLLDLDGTLVDTAYLHTLAWQRALAARRRVVPAYRIHRLIGVGGDKFVSALLGDDAEREFGDELRALWGTFYGSIIEEARVLPGAAELIEYAGGDGWTVVFASSAPASQLDRYLDLLGASSLRDHATTGDDVEETKPAPDIVEQALGLAGTRRALLVGDSTHDVLAASRAGIRAVCLLAGGYGKAELLEAGASGIYDTPADLLGHFQQLTRLLGP
jgi:HAD superfamily hydrolase (TIGR01509 family)